MKRLLTAALLCVMALPLGCAAILAPKTNPIPITTTGSRAAEVYIDGIKRGETPLTLELDPRRSYTLVFKSPGLEDRIFELRSQVGAGWVILDVLFGLIPVIVDASTGAWYYLEPDAVQVAMGPPEEGEPMREHATPQCNLSETEEWRRASAVEKKRLLEECKRRGAP